jgi:hypothetical protein
MLSRKQAKEIIKKTVKESLLSYVKNKIKKKPTFQVLDLIIPKERKIRSTVGGLETSLGTTLWEPLAKALAKENGFEIITEKLKCPTNMPSSLNNILQTIVDDRKKKDSSYDAERSHTEIKKVCQTFVKRKIESFEPAPKGFGVDIWLKKNNVNYFFDTKTVQPNLGALTKCMEQVLNWYAYFYSRYPTEIAESRIVFPYNPHSVDFWDRVIGKGKPLERDKEAWVEDQFWDFCSGITGTYSIIKEAFIELEKSKELEKELISIFYSDVIINTPNKILIKRPKKS